MAILSAKNTLDGATFLVTLDDGTVLHVPDVAGNRDRQELQEWVDDGNVIAPADPAPPPPTKGDVIDNEIIATETIAGLITEVAKLKGVSDTQLIVDIKVGRGA